MLVAHIDKLKFELWVLAANSFGAPINPCISNIQTVIAALGIKVAR